MRNVRSSSAWATMQCTRRLSRLPDYRTRCCPPFHPLFDLSPVPSTAAAASPFSLTALTRTVRVSAPSKIRVSAFFVFSCQTGRNADRRCSNLAGGEFVYGISFSLRVGDVLALPGHEMRGEAVFDVARQRTGEAHLEWLRRVGRRDRQPPRLPRRTIHAVVDRRLEDGGLAAHGPGD